MKNGATSWSRTGPLGVGHLFGMRLAFDDDLRRTGPVGLDPNDPDPQRAGRRLRGGWFGAGHGRTGRDLHHRGPARPTPDRVAESGRLVPILLLAGRSTRMPSTTSAAITMRSPGGHLPPATKWSARCAASIRSRRSWPGLSGDDVGAAPSGRALPSQDLMRAPCGVSAELPASRLRPAHCSGRRDRAGRRDPRPGETPDHPGRRRRALSGAADELEDLAHRLGAPVITSLNARLASTSAIPLPGTCSSIRARIVLPQADVMLAVGCRFTELLTDWRRLPIPPR